MLSMMVKFPYCIYWDFNKSGFYLFFSHINEGNLEEVKEADENERNVEEEGNEDENDDENSKMNGIMQHRPCPKHQIPNWKMNMSF